MANRIIRGPAVTIAEREFNLPIIMDELQIAMDDDPEDAQVLSETMILSYAGFDKDQRTAYNQAMIDICGYGMKSLLTEAGAEEDLLLALDFELPPKVEDDSDIDSAP